MKAPSTGWRENVRDDEEARFRRHGEQLIEIQKRKSAQHGKGRALHRKQHLGLQASFEVLDGLPEHSRHGLFAKPGKHAAQIRLSNGGADIVSDKAPDIRGFALRVLDVDGPGALGAPTKAQCFVLINSETFAFGGVDEFVAVVVAAQRGSIAVLRQLIKRNGVLGGFREARRLGKGLGKPFAGFASEPFYSAAPVACGPYAAKLRLVPTTPGAPSARRDDWAGDVVSRVTKGELRWDLQLQFFVDDAVTPIEDTTVAWPEAEAPFVTVARVVVPQQDPRSADGATLAKQIEASVFDPWNALADHRPLGEIMRARKVAYFASQRERGAV